MKKLLLSTTALATAGVLAFSAPDAMAKGKALKIKLGGFMSATAGFMDNSGSFEVAPSGATSETKRDSFNIIQDSEIYFTGSGTLDNGLTVSVVMQLESDQANGTDIDESYMKISSKAMGELKIGSVASAGATLKHTAVYTGPYRLDTPDVQGWIGKPTAVTTGGATNIGGADANKIVYISPKLGGGFRLGLAYTPSATNSNAAPAIGGNAGTETQQYDSMISWESKMGSTDVKADIGYFEDHGTALNSFKALRGGLNLGFGDTTIGVAVMGKEDIDTGKSGTANTDEQDVWEVGASTKMGAYTIGAAYLHSESPTAATGDDQHDLWNVGVSTAIGPGMTASAGVYHADWDDSGDADTDHNDGWMAVGQIKVTF